MKNNNGKWKLEEMEVAVKEEEKGSKINDTETHDIEVKDAEETSTDEL